MKKEVIVKLHASFEESVQKDEDGGEYWLARDLQQLLGYAKWENFAKVIGKAKTACAGSGVNPDDHFLDPESVTSNSPNPQLRLNCPGQSQFPA